MVLVIAECSLERADEPAFRRPIADGEDDSREHPPKRPLQRGVKKPGDLARVIAEGAAPPGAQDHVRVIVRHGDREDARDAPRHGGTYGRSASSIALPR